MFPVFLALLAASGGHATATSSTADVTEEPRSEASSLALAAWALVRPYGTLKPTVIVSSGAVESYSQPNASAVTAAGNPVLSTVPKDARWTFQAAQSRFGVRINEAGVVRAQVEFDAIDFSKASPTVASLPRLRIAKGEWRPIPELTLVVGQDWDLNAPLNPFGSNLVGAFFQSGNTGFIREQVQLLWKTEHGECGLALGMSSPNTTSRDGSPELGLLPSAALRLIWLPGAGLRLGISGIGSVLRLAPGPTETRLYAGQATLFGELIAAQTVLRFEGYVGQNVANLGLLGLGLGGAEQDVRELGGFLSLRQGITEGHALYLNIGGALSLNPESVRPSYASAAGTPALSGTGPGIKSNLGGVLGYELRLHTNLAFAVEAFLHRTRHALQAADQGLVEGLAFVFGSELAMIVTF